MKAKKLGVIGGMGPMATSLFFEKLVENTVAKRDQDHIDAIILNHATMPDRTEAILTKQGDKFLEAIKKDIDLLEAAGVAHIAIPCNTAHYFYDDIQKMTPIPIIHMIEKTAEHIAGLHTGNGKVAVLATNGTVKSGIYGEACRKFGLDCYYPDDDRQEKVMEIIYQYKGGVLLQKELEEIIDHCITEEQASYVILGCTELSCIPISPEHRKYCVDPMDVLVQQSILLSGKELNPDFTI